ncbi:MAG: hypothetical protein ABFD70_13875, partial [Syntrophaceae bacterium]
PLMHRLLNPASFNAGKTCRSSTISLKKQFAFDKSFDYVSINGIPETTCTGYAAGENSHEKEHRTRRR